MDITMNIRGRLRELYHGTSARAVRFQRSVMAVDLAIVGFFLFVPLIIDRPIFYWLDYSIAAFILLDLVGRALASADIRKWFRCVDVWIDIMILATLLAPLWLINLSFLRAFRLWTVARSEVFWRPLRKRGYAPREDAIRALVSVVTFIFLSTGFVYTFFAGRAEGLNTYVDALYFTVATVTTTGFGDILLPGTAGKLTSVVAMIIGISLFVGLAQAVVRPRKVNFVCPECALMRHDVDAVHCKACGHQLKIPDTDE
jgi:voltage-gated potassium channel